MLDLPPVIGHRGAAGIAPENTLAGFRAAREAGARWVEFDVRLAADAVPVVIHDATLERLAGRKAAVVRLTGRMLAGTDVGAGEGVPTLAEALAECRALGLGANVELKWCGVRSLALARETARAIAAAGRQPVLVSSFRPALLAAFRRKAAAVPLGLLLERPRPGWQTLAGRLGCASVHMADSALGERAALQSLVRAGLPVVVYTVNRAARARALLAGGVRAVITDRPDRLIAALGDIL